MNKEMEALERMLTYKISSKTKFGMKNVEDYNLVKSALTELADIKARADKVIFTYALDLVDISNGVKHGDEQPINDFIEAINYILKGETK